MLIELTVTEEFPVFLITTLAVWGEPSTTPPKLILLGVTDRVRVSAIPVPDNGMERVGFVAVLETVMAPESPPTAVGLKDTVKAVDAPAFKTCGVVRFEKLKPVPLANTLDMVMAWEPLLVRTTDWEFVDPTGGDPSETPDGVALIAEPELATEADPERV